MKAARLTLHQAARRVFRSLPIAGQPERIGPRPKTRGECEDGCRPCPWTECRYHLAVDVISDGRVSFSVLVRDWDWSRPTCALDVADDGPKSVREVAEIVGVNFQRVHAIEQRAKESARLAALLEKLEELDDEEDYEEIVRLCGVARRL